MKPILKFILLLLCNICLSQTNLLDTSTWAVGTGSAPGFTRTGTDAENIREMGIGPHGNSVLLWKGVTDGTAANDDGGWKTVTSIDSSKTYRCTVWMRKTNSNDGHTYFGVSARDTSGDWALNSLENVTQTNTFFHNGPVPILDNWYLFVGYIHHSNYSSTVSVGGLYDGATGNKVIDYNDRKFQSTAEKLTIWPMMHRGTPNTADALYLYAPTIYEINGQEPTIQELIDGHDTQAPTAPTLSNGAQTDITVDLSWTAAADNIAVTGYNVYRDGILETALGNVLSYQVAGLTASTAYNFTVTALDAAGNESAVSNTVTINTSSAGGAFFILEHIRASDDMVTGTITDGYSVTSTNATTFNVNAIPSSSIGSAVFTLTGPISRNVIESVSPYALYSDDNGNFKEGPNLTTGSYSLTITAWSAAGGTGTQIAQDIVNFTVTAPNTDLEAPTPPTLSSIDQTDTTIDLSWTAATDNIAVTGYKVYKDSILETTLGSVLSYQVTGLTASTAYNFTVTALDAAGNESAISNTLAITTDATTGGGTGSYWSLNNQDVYYNTGNVGIGTNITDSKLTVKGSIHSEEVKVDLSVPAPDYVFESSYNLTSLEKLQEYIITHGHLPNMPSAKEMETHGIELGIMNMKLLEKIEELTLYILQQQRELYLQSEKNKTLENRLIKLENLIKK